MSLKFTYPVGGLSRYTERSVVVLEFFTMIITNQNHDSRVANVVVNSNELSADTLPVTFKITSVSVKRY